MKDDLQQERIAELEDQLGALQKQLAVLQTQTAALLEQNHRLNVAGCVDPREVGDRRGSQPGFDTGGSGKESHFFGPWPRLRLA